MSFQQMMETLHFQHYENYKNIDDSNVILHGSQDDVRGWGELQMIC